MLDYAVCICSVFAIRSSYSATQDTITAFRTLMDAALPAGPLSAEPSFAFHCKAPHRASASQGSPPSSRLQQHSQQLSTLPVRSAAPDGATSYDAQASLHQPDASLSTTPQQLTVTSAHAVHHGQATEPSGQHSSSDLQQSSAWQAAPDRCQWQPLLPPADETADCHAAGWEASAYTPQELADHLEKLKKEFRQIYSTILDGEAQLPDAAAAVVSLLVNLGLSRVPNLMIRTSSHVCGQLSVYPCCCITLVRAQQVCFVALHVRIWGDVYGLTASDTIIKLTFVLWSNLPLLRASCPG